MSSISAGTSAGTALVSTGDTTGALQLQVNGTTPSITLAANGSIGVGSSPGYGTSGQVLTSAGSAAAPTWAAVSTGPTLGTPVNTTSGTSIDFTGIPSGVKLVYVSFFDVSGSAAANYIVQLGDSGGIETTGYLSCSTYFSGGTATASAYTNAFGILLTANSAATLHGLMIFSLENSSTNRWVLSGTLNQSDQTVNVVTSGSKPLSAVLDRIRITTVAGTATFTAGQINIAYA
jgi:hypothetical protein